MSYIPKRIRSVGIESLLMLQYVFVFARSLWRKAKKKKIQFDHRSIPDLDRWPNDRVRCVHPSGPVQVQTRARIRRRTIRNTSWNRIILLHCARKHFRSVPNTQWSYKCTRIHPSVGRETYTLRQTFTNRPRRKHLCFFFARLDSTLANRPALSVNFPPPPCRMLLDSDASFC